MEENIWEFQLKNKISNLSKLSLEENTDFWLDSMKSWFYGYKTAEDYKIVIWNKEVDFSFSIAPYGTPTEKFPTVSKKTKNVLLSPEQKAHIKILRGKIKELRKHLPELPNEAMEKRYFDYIDFQSFNKELQYAAVIWDNKEIEISEKCYKTGEQLGKLLPILQNMQLPKELMRDDTKFCLKLSRVLQFAQNVKKNIEKNKAPVSEKLDKLIVFLDKFIDEMIDGGNKIFGIERKMTLEEYNTYLELYGETLSEEKPFNERLAVLERLWENLLLSPVDRIEHLEEGIKLIKNQNTKEFNICPYEELIKKHLLEISGYIEEVEKEGEKIWCNRMAESLIDSLILWREATGDSPLSVEEFAAQIELQSVHIETKEEKDKSIQYSLELYFKDKTDSFAGHSMYALVENHVIKEITLMG